MSVLVVVESPSKAKTIQKYLGSNYIIRPTVGHIVDLVKGGKSKIGVDIDNGFKPIYTVIPDKKDKIAAIKDAARNATEILIASDPDREGEAIAFHVQSQIADLNKPIKRVLFHEITKSGVKKGVNSPIELNQDLFDAQQARRVLDRLVGFMVSPYLMSSLGPGNSAGRVQSVCLRLIVERDKERENFIPEIYYVISATLSKDKKEKFVAKYTKKIISEKTAKKIKQDLDNSSYIVHKVVGKKQKRNPYPPLTTSKMQQSAAGLYKFSAKKTMTLAQKLYEQGHVTYIRSDSLRCSPESIDSVRSWISSQGHDLPNKPNFYKNKDASQDAHEAIRPTDVELTSDSFTGPDDERKLYKLIWERFVASQMKPAIYDTVAVDIKTSTGHMLRANGRTLKYKGWLAITADIEKKKEADVQLPVLKEKDDLYLVPPKVKMEKKETQPPPLYSDGSLIKELEKRGIGRPSTYASILSKISDRNYVEKTKTQYSSTQLGRTVVDKLLEFFSFMNYDYTKSMEILLDKIAEGDKTYLETIKEFFNPFKEELKTAQNSQYKDGGQDCEYCGKRMVLKHGKFGFYISCSGKCKNNKSVDVDGDKITIKKPFKKEVYPGFKCPKCSGEMTKKDGKFGPFLSCMSYPKCKGNAKLPYGKKCPKCDSELFLTIFKGKPVLFCMGYPDCKHGEDAPEDVVDPQKIMPKKDKMAKKVDRILEKE